MLENRSIQTQKVVVECFYTQSEEKKGLIFLKRLLSFFVFLCFAFGIVGCASGMTAVENALIAIKAFDLDTFSACMTADFDKAAHSSRWNSLDETEKTTMRSLYSLVKYSIEGETDGAKGERLVTVKVSVPDFARVRTLAEKKILVSADTASAVVAEMLESGEIAGGYMLTLTWEIVMTEESGEYRIPYTDKRNAAFSEGLALSDMLKFFTKY